MGLFYPVVSITTETSDVTVRSGRKPKHFNSIILVRVSTALKRYHDQGKSCKQLGLAYTFRGSVAWQHAGRHDVGVPKNSIP